MIPARGVHGVNHEITAPDALITDLLERLGEATNTPVLAKSDSAVAEAGHDVVGVPHGSVHLLEQPLRALRLPMLWDRLQPWHAGILHRGIGLEAVDQDAVPPLSICFSKAWRTSPIT